MGVTRYVLPFLSITAIILGIAYGKDEVLVRSCPQDKSSWDTAARRKECKPEGGQNYEYHCVKNERQELVETCMVAQWIEKGVCPILFDSGSFGAENCTSRTFLGPCPTMVYRSNEVYAFLLCFVSTTMTTSTTRTTTEMKTTVSTPVEEKETTTAIPDDGENIAGIILGVLVVLFASVGAGIVVWKCRSQNGSYIRPLTKCRDRDIEQGSEIEEPMTEPLLHSSTKSVQPERKIVQLAAFAKGKKILTENGILVITGRVGSGKSTAMNRIIELLNDDQCDEKKWKVEEALSWNKELQYEGQVIITWDDCFGQFVTYPTKKEKTRQRIKELVKWIKVDDQNRKLVLTMTETVFNVVDLSEGEENYCKLCLDGMLNEEKSSLVAATSEYIRKYSDFKDDTWDEVKKKLHELIGKEDESVKISSLGLPLICRLATIPYIASDFAAFIEDPFTCVQSLFDDLNSTNQNLLLYCAMIGVSFKVMYSSKDPDFLRKFKEEIEKNKLHPTNDKEKADIVGMLNSGDAIIKTLSSELNRESPSAYSHYFLKTGKEDFQLCHNIFQLWLLCHFYKQFPELTIQYLDFDLLLELLRPTNHINEMYEEEIAQICGFEDKDKAQICGFEDKYEDAASEDNNENKNWRFILERNMYDLFFGRVKTKDEKSLIENKQNSVLNHPLLDDSTFKTLLQVKFYVTKDSTAV